MVDFVPAGWIVGEEVDFVPAGWTVDEELSVGIIESDDAAADLVVGWL